MWSNLSGDIIWMAHWPSLIFCSTIEIWTLMNCVTCKWSTVTNFMNQTPPKYKVQLLQYTLTRLQLKLDSGYLHILIDWRLQMCAWYGVLDKMTIASPWPPSLIYVLCFIGYITNFSNKSIREESKRPTFRITKAEIKPGW